jgi:hypothetical protein
VSYRVQVIVLDIERGIQICIQGVITVNALKLSLVFPVGFGNISTARTLPGRIPGINKDNKTAMFLSLVCEKLLQLIERPAMKLSVLVMSLTTPLKDIFEILKNYCGPNRKGLDYGLGYAVVHISAKTVLLLGQFLKVSFCRSCSTGLKRIPQVLISLRHSPDSSSTEKLKFRRNSKSLHTSVDPDKEIRSIFRTCIWNYFLKDKNEKDFSFSVNQVCGLTSPAQKLIHIFIGLKLKSLAAMYGKDGNFVSIEPNIVGIGI